MDARTLALNYQELMGEVKGYYDLLGRLESGPFDRFTRLANDAFGYAELFREVVDRIDRSVEVFTVAKAFDPKAVAWMAGEVRTMAARIRAGDTHAVYAIDFIRDIVKSNIFSEAFVALRADDVKTLERLIRAHQSVLGHKGAVLGIESSRPAPPPAPTAPAAEPAPRRARSILAAAQAKVGEILALPHPAYVGDVSIEECLKVRRSRKEFAAAPLALDQVSQLLFAAQGITDPRGFRTAPSAKAAYPLELSVVARDVEGLVPGAYLYDPFEHQLTRTRGGHFDTELAAACRGHAWIAEAPLIVVLSAYATTMFGMTLERSTEYGLLETGHAAQNMLLQAQALDLAAICASEFDAAAVRTLLAQKGAPRPIYLVCFGRQG